MLHIVVTFTVGSTPEYQPESREWAVLIPLLDTGAILCGPLRRLNGGLNSGRRGTDGVVVTSDL
jgi:hypothetical protein